jgi:hypothetical protein
MVFMLAVVVATLGAMPQAALCIAENHESHVVFGHMHDHHMDGDSIPHDDDEPLVCGHEIDHDDCGDGGCLDVSLGVAGIASDGATAAHAPGIACETLAPQTASVGGQLVDGGGPPRPIEEIYLASCSFLI